MVTTTEAISAQGSNRSLLAINSGSSTIKYALFTFAHEPQALSRGLLDVPNRATAIQQLLERVAGHIAEHPLAGIGHRIVHGGPTLRQPQVVTTQIVQTLKELVRFAPNHLPDAIAVVESISTLRPGTPQILCFDTAFHGDLPDVSRRLAVPPRYAAEGVQRYGFHGLSYTFLLGELDRRTGGRTARRVILAHLGNGSSLAAVLDGRSIDTTMGFTPIGGIVMSTRSGDLDPGVVTYIARSSGLDPDQVEHELSHDAGLAGLSGGFSDMRELLAREATDPSCRIAAAIYCYEISKQIGAYAAALGGLDALVFSGGIGEHAGVVRSRICENLGFLGISIDEARNAANAPIISIPAASVAVHVIPTDEELVVARAAWLLLS